MNLKSMNLKSVVNFEVEKEGNLYVFSIPMGAPYGQAYDAAFEVLQKIVEMSQQAADAQKRTSLETPLEGVKGD